MWILYKLVPLAGILSMFLSMGATITPSDVGEYESGKAFSYGGLMPTVRTEAATKEGNEENLPDVSGLTKFVRKVEARANDNSGGDVRLQVWIGIGFQFFFIGVVLVALWNAQRGAVIPWWCRASTSFRIGLSSTY